MPAHDKLYINGIDGVTGQYLLQPIDYAAAASMIKGSATDQGTLSWLRRIWRTISQPHLGLPLDVNPELVEQSGWAVVFLKDEDPAVKAALEPLIEHRRKQINNDSKVKVLEYRGQNRADWLSQYGVGAGTVEPTKVPYYLLLVGSPEHIPFSFCHQLDVEYAVGWLHFDTADEYKQYVESLINYETGQIVPNGKEAVFFGTRHSFDQATQMSADLLVNPLADGASNDPTTSQGVAQQWGFRSRKIWGDSASKSALSNVFKPLAGAKSPALLFTASHGMAWPKGHTDQYATQGALLCQDWPGFGTITADHYFSAKDIPADGQFHGLVTFHFACYGAGTPMQDRFIHKPGEAPPAIADQPFLAALPKKLLTHPNGGALACIGHVERAWGYSIVTQNAGAQLLPFQNAISRMLVGQPVAYAMKDFNERYAALSTSLSSMLEELSFGAQISNFELASAWIERNDAEGYIVMGDPAVRLRVSELK
jgi:Peptidase family C25